MVKDQIFQDLTRVLQLFW